MLLSLWLSTKQSWWSCWCSVAFFPKGVRKIFEPRTLKSIASYNQRSLCTKVCLQNARSPFVTSILEMRSGRKRPSKGSGQRCLTARRISRELCITKACLTFLRSSELSWLAGHFGIEKTRKLVAMKYYGDLQLVPIPTRALFTIRFSLLSVGLQRWYTGYDLIIVIIGL